MTVTTRPPGLLSRLVAIVLVAGAVTGALGIYLLRASAQDTLRREALDRERQVAERMASLLDDRLGSIINSLRQASSRRPLATFGADSNSELRVITRLSTQYDTLELFDAAGKPRAAAATRSLAKVASIPPRPDIIQRLRNNTFALKVLLNDQPGLEIAVPVEDPPGMLVGALVSTVAIEELAQPIEALHLSPGGVAFLTDASGRILAHPERNRALEGERFPVADVLAGAASSGKRIEGDAPSLAGVAAAQVFPGAVVVEQPEAEALATASSSLRKLSVILAVVVAVIIAAVALVARSLLRGLRPLNLAVRRLGSGDLEARASLAGAAEIGALAVEFNRMADELSAGFAREREITARLQELDELKDEFLATVSHELRTPLTPILGFSETLMDQDEALGSAARLELVGRVRRNALEMHKLIEQLLNFSQLEAGKITVQSKTLELVPLMGEVLEKFEPALAEHKLIVDVPDGICVLADPDPIERILGNLLGNAAKYSPQGTRIWVKADVDPEFVTISVRDEGPGIPEADRTRVFERFYQGPGRRTGLRGAGLGLSIAHRYVDLLGGRVWVESEEGRGATFCFTVRATRKDEG